MESVMFNRCWMVVGLVLLLGFGACALSRQDAVVEISHSACDRVEACAEIDPAFSYTSRMECEVGYQEDFYELWPVDNCPDGSFDEVTFADCVSRTGSFPCGGSFLDLLGFLDACNASKVCTVAP